MTGKALGLLLILVALAMAYLLLGQSNWQFPENISLRGGVVDAQFRLTLAVVGPVLVAVHLALAFALWRFGRRRGAPATHSQGGLRLEAGWTLITAVIFIGLALLGQRAWAELGLGDASADAVKVSVVAQQFQWNFHYAGSDGTFGRTSPEFYNDSGLNFVGLDPSDPAGRDDVQAATLVLPAGRPVELSLRSKDVIHSFFVPQLRFKQDTVPGMETRVHFTATKPGRYEIPCAELCGSNHFLMKSYLLVLPGEEYDDLVVRSEDDFRARLAELMLRFN